MSELEDKINNLFLNTQASLEQSIDIKKYAESLIKEIYHRVICKNTLVFELWLRVSTSNNVKTIIKELETAFKYSAFEPKKIDAVSNYIWCSIGEPDAGVIHKSLDSEQYRFESRKEVIDQLIEKKRLIQKDYDEKMTILQQFALDLQKKRDREIAAVHSSYLKDKKEIESKMNIQPKEYQDTLSEINEKLSLLRKCSHGFSYNSTIFHK